MNYLKNTFVIVLLFSFIISSCSSEDDGNSTPQQPNDKVELTLTTSKSAYQNANVGSWVKITELEYNLLELTIDNVTKVGTYDEQYDFNGDILPVSASSNGITMANNNGASMPTNSYIFAFKYNVTEDDVDSAKVKISNTNPQDEYANLGSTLPMHDSGDNYFVLKRNNTPTTNSGFLAIYSPKKIGYKELANNTVYYFSQSDTSNLETTGGTNTAIILYQGLSTTVKQWD